MERIFFPFNSELKKEIDEIKFLIQGEQNVVVAHSMNKMAYKKNYGASYTSLVRIAEPYIGNAKLADCMWSIGFRETMILATLIYPTDKFSDKKALAWVKEMPEYELVEYACKNLYVKCANAYSLVPKLLTSSAPFAWEMAFLLTSRLLLSDKVNDAVCQSLLETVPQGIALSRGSLTNAMANFLKQLGVFKAYQATVLSLLDHTSDSDDMQQKWVAQEVRSHIDFMPVKSVG